LEAEHAALINTGKEYGAIDFTPSFTHSYKISNNYFNEWTPKIIFKQYFRMIIKITIGGAKTVVQPPLHQYYLCSLVKNNNVPNPK